MKDWEGCRSLVKYDKILIHGKKDEGILFLFKKPLYQSFICCSNNRYAEVEKQTNSV